MVIEYDEVISSIEKPNGKHKKIAEYQDTDDIIKDLIYCFRSFNFQAKPVAKKFGTGNFDVDARNIYDYVKNNIDYKAEPVSDQTTRSFSAIQHDKWGDCKHTALTAGSIAWNEGYSVIFRVVRYVFYKANGKKSYLCHVYAVLEDKNGRRIIVDPLQSYNYEKPFDKKIGDFKAENNMALTRITGVKRTPFRRAVPAKMIPLRHTLEPHETYVLDGIGGREMVLTPMGMTEDGIGEIETLEGIGRKSKAQRQENKAARKELHKEKKTERKRIKTLPKGERKKVRKENRKARGGVVKAVALAPIRGAFSALLLINFGNFAGRFKQAMEMGKEDKLKAFAKKFGYNYTTFKSQIMRGANNKAVDKINGAEYSEVEGMGVVVTAAALTTASVAVAAALTLLKNLGLKTPGDNKQLKDSMDNVQKLAENPSAENAANAASAAVDTFSNSGGRGMDNASADQGGSSEGSGGGSSSTPRNSKGGDESGSMPEGFFAQAVEIAKNNPIPTVVVGGTIVYVLGKKVFKLW